MHHTTHYFKVLYISDMWFNCCFKEIQRSRSVCIRSNRNTTCIMYSRHFINKWNDITQEFHQSANSHIFTCTHTENREHTTCSQSFTNTFTHFVFCKRFRFEEFLHQSFIMFGSSFYQSLMPSLSFFHFLSRNFFDSRCSTVRTP